MLCLLILYCWECLKEHKQRNNASNTRYVYSAEDQFHNDIIRENQAADVNCNMYASNTTTNSHLTCDTSIDMCYSACNDSTLCDNDTTCCNSNTD